MKQQKPTLKDEFIEKFSNYVEDVNEIFSFFEPHLKKQLKPKVVIDIPLDKIKEFNEIWPQIKLPTKQYARCTERELVSSFTAFFKEFPTYNDWSIIMQAGTTYISEREIERYEFTRRSKYFVRRENKDKSVDFLLQEYYERIRDGVQEKPVENFSFEPKIY